MKQRKLVFFATLMAALFFIAKPVAVYAEMMEDSTEMADDSSDMATDEDQDLLEAEGKLVSVDLDNSMIVVEAVDYENEEAMNNVELMVVDETEIINEEILAKEDSTEEDATMTLSQLEAGDDVYVEYYMDESGKKIVSTIWVTKS